VSRCNHFTLTKHSTSMKSIARLELDPLQHVVINFGRQFVCKIVFRLGQKNGWEKYVTRKKVFMFLPSHVFAETRSPHTPVTYRTTTTARTTFLSSAVQSAAVLDFRFENEKDHSRRAGSTDRPRPVDRDVECIRWLAKHAFYPGGSSAVVRSADVSFSVRDHL
jgi:hypothetical protein